VVGAFVEIAKKPEFKNIVEVSHEKHKKFI